MALADPDLPAGVAVPELSAAPPRGLDADRYRWLRDAYYELPRRSRVTVVLRIGVAGRQPLTLRAIGDLLGIGQERVRQLEHHAVWVLLWGWMQRSPGGMTRGDQTVLLSPILAAAIDRYPLDADPPVGKPR